jgi:hypothetical protein
VVFFPRFQLLDVAAAWSELENAIPATLKVAEQEMKNSQNKHLMEFGWATQSLAQGAIALQVIQVVLTHFTHLDYDCRLAIVWIAWNIREFV